MSNMDDEREDWERDRAAWNLPRPKRPRNEVPLSDDFLRALKHRTASRTSDEQSSQKTRQGIEEV